MTLSVPLCALCSRQVAGTACAEDVELVEEGYSCALCFGILDTPFVDQVCAEVERVLASCPYDATSFILALGLPVSQMLREVVIKKAFPQFDGILVTVPFKIRNIDAYLKKLSNASGLRPTLASDLQLTIDFENNQFLEADHKFLSECFPQDMRRGKKRGNGNEVLLSKMDLTQFVNRITPEMARKYTLSRPTQHCTFTVSLDRDPVYVAGRYCKYSRSLPQSPWSPDEEVPPVPGYSVTEKVCDILQKEFGAADARFVSSGREDVDVRMLGEGRPFVVHLINCKRTQPLHGLNYVETLQAMTAKINADKDIRVLKLTRVSREAAEEVSFGQEDKIKTYTAYCYSTLPITQDALERVEKMTPFEIIQKTPVRVMKRRSLLDRPRSIYTLQTLNLDSHHFLIRLATQAGTYIKEFVHGDFGRTRPSMADLLGVEMGEIDILELDVEKVDMEWPPNYPPEHFFK